MRVGGIQPRDLVQLRVKDRVLYGEVLEVADGIVRFRRSAPPPAGTGQQPSKSSGTGAKRDEEQAAGRAQPQRPAPCPQQLPLPKPES